MTALIPDNCWKNIRPREMRRGLKLFPVKSSENELWDSFLSLSTCVFSIAVSSSVISAFFPRSHCKDLRAFFVFPLEMYHLGVSGIMNIRIRNGTGKEAPKSARFHQFKYAPATKQTKIPVNGMSKFN